MGRDSPQKKVPVFITDILLAWKYGNNLYPALVLIVYLITVSAMILGDVGRVRWGFIAVCIAVLPALAEILTPVRFPWLMKCLVALPLILHMAGGLYGFYFTGYPVYDKVCHFVASVALAFLVFEMILIVASIFDAKPSQRVVMGIIFVLVIFFALSWEYAEYNLDVVSGSTFFLTFEDSVMDMVFNTLGICFVLYWVSRYMNRESFDKVVQRFVSTSTTPRIDSL